jgi:isopenicillin-N epimerase
LALARRHAELHADMTHSQSLPSPQASSASPAWARSGWLLDPDVTFLNHGSFGATPRVVLAEQDRWRERMERHPTGFMAFELPKLLETAAARLADFVGAEVRDLAFVANATEGCNTVLNAFPLESGDEILVTDHGYAAIRKAAEHAASKAGACVVEAAIPLPLSAPAAIIAAIGSRLGPRTRLVILDHITSSTAVLSPIHELTSLCRSRGAAVLVDGAHAPGMLSLDIPSIGADWYVGNCHKWLMAPKGSGFLWTAPGRQAGMHPLVISHGYRRGFRAEFDWTGTRDPSAWLSVPAAIDFHQQLGGPALRARNIALAREAAALLAGRWRSERATPDLLMGSMAAVRLPTDGAATMDRALKLRAELFDAYRIEVAINPFGGALWARISAQAYNVFADYERLAEVFGG